MLDDEEDSIDETIAANRALRARVAVLIAQLRAAEEEIARLQQQLTGATDEPCEDR